MANENGIGRWRKYNAEMEIYEQLRDDVMDDARSLGMSEKKPLAEDMRHTDGVPTEEQAEGGYGIFLVKQFFSSVTYRYEEMFGEMANHLTMELLL